jgi:hypothetical protein
MRKNESQPATKKIFFEIVKSKTNELDSSFLEILEESESEPAA